jgi:hypothetical protein
MLLAVPRRRRRGRVEPGGDRRSNGRFTDLKSHLEANSPFTIGTISLRTGCPCWPRTCIYNTSVTIGYIEGGVLGPYEIVSPFGAGGMGEVYGARGRGHRSRFHGRVVGEETEYGEETDY